MQKQICFLIIVGLFFAANRVQAQDARMGQAAQNTFPSSGNVGIGTTSPVQDLHLRATSGNADISIQPATGTGWNIAAGTDGKFYLAQRDFGTNAYNDKLVITPGGNVGIGTSNPTQDLHLKATSGNADFSLQPQDGTGWNLAASTDGKFYLAQRDFGANTYNDKLVITSDGYTGIGTRNPQAPLHVVGERSSNNPLPIKYFNGDGGLYQSTGWAGGITALFEGNAVATAAFIGMKGTPTFSDARFKNILGESNTANDLTTLNKIKITDYTFIDKATLGDKVQKKVIAQQVEEVFPNAVSTIQAFTPNIYALAKEVKSVGGNLQITMENPHELKANDKIKWISPSGETIYSEVTNIVSPLCFELTSTETVEQAFIYGKQVDDFRIVDYDAISMLNVSATQELYKMILALKAENMSLKSNNASLKADVEVIKAHLGLNAHTSNK